MVEALVSIRSASCSWVMPNSIRPMTMRTTCSKGARRARSLRYSGLCSAAGALHSRHRYPLGSLRWRVVNLPVAADQNAPTARSSLVGAGGRID